MVWTPEETEGLLPPEEQVPPTEPVAAEVPPAEAAAPVDQAPPPPPPPAPTGEWTPEQTESAPAPQAAPPLSDVVAGAGAPVPSPGLGGVIPPEGGAGPLQQATNALGQAMAPITEQLPEPVQNLTDIVGQPVGGTLDAVQSVANELGQGDIPGAVGAGLGALSGPWARGVEQTGANIAAGEPAIPTIDQMIANPANILAVPSGVASRYGPAPAITGTTEEDWFASLPPDEQASLARQGGVAMNQAWLESIGGSPVPPPQLSNPLDAATSQNPLERLGQVAGALPQFGAGWIESAKQGTLPPFLLSQAQNIVEDPLTLIPGVLGERALARGGELARRVPIIDKLASYTPAEEARLASERLGTATEEYTRAGISQLPTSGWPPGEGPPPGVNRPAITPEIPQNPIHLGVQDVRNQVGGTETITPESLQRAPAFRQSLIDQGHDAIIITHPDRPAEVVSLTLSRTEVANQQARNNVGVAYSATPPGYQRLVSETLAPDPNFHRGVTASRDTITLMKEQADGRFTFRNGEKPTMMSVADVVATTNEGIHKWLTGFERDGTPKAWTQAADKVGRAWQSLNKKFDPHGDVDPVPMMAGMDNPAARVSAAERRADFLVNVLNDAIQESLPVAKRTKAMGAFGQWTNAIRQSMLFNVMNVPRYIAQNLSTNTINITTRGGGLRPAISVWTNVKEMGRILGHQKDNSPTTLNSVFKHTGMGERPNMLMTQRPYFDRITGEMPKWLKIPTDIVAPEFGRFMASVPDIHAREAVGMQAIQNGYREINKTLVPTVYEQFRRQTPTQLPPLETFQRVVTDFLNENRHIPDAKTGEPLTNLLGVPAKFEAMWNPDALRAHLKEHLYDGVPSNRKPYPGQINRAVNDLTGMMRDKVREIGDNADATVDAALFPWRNTVADEGLSHVTLFHYYMSRQGGFYLSEMMKHPWVASAYGRMMAEMEEQNTALGGPDWMTGWFQFQQSVGGFSTWFSPFDFVQSLLTMADWQTGADDPDKYTDLTRVGQAMKQFPFMVHPLIAGVGYGLGLLGPDYPAPNLTGTETFGAKAIQLLNLANAEDAGFMKVFNAMGVGVDHRGNKIPIAPRPLQDLYGTVGHAISAAMMPITGLAPVESTPSWASMAADVQAIGEQETRKAHPEWDNGTDEGQMQIDSHVTEVLADPGNPEYQHWYQLATSEPYQLGAGVNPIAAGLARIASPIQIRTQPEQRALDQRKGGLEESGNAPMRTLDDGLTDKVFQTAKGAISKTLEGRALEEQKGEYGALAPAGLSDARAVMAQITHFDFESGSSPEIAGESYTNKELEDMTGTERYNLTQQYLTEQGFSDEENQAAYDLQNEYLRDHPDYAAYRSYTSLVDEVGGPQAFTEQMMQTNPSFAQYVRSSMTDHITGVINYDAVWGTDAFLAAQGVRPSQYSPTTGNEPSTAPGGYPSIPGVEEGQPILPTGELSTNAVGDTFIYQTAKDVTWNNKPGHEAVAIVKPDLPIQTLGRSTTFHDDYTNTDYTMVQVALMGQPDKPIGWIDQSMLVNASPSRPVGRGTVQQPGGGLVEQAGNVMNALGTAKDALGGGLGAVGGAISGAIPEPPPIAASAPEPLTAAPIAPSGGGNPLDAIGAGLGAVMDAAGRVVNTLSGHNAGTPQKPTTTTSPGVTPGKVAVIPAPDGMGISTDPGPTDQTWLENMIGKGHAAVTVQYKGDAPPGVDYSYQNGHGAQMMPCPSDPNSMCYVHAAVDVSCDTGDCWGTPIYAPVDGTIGCAGYGNGDSGNPAATCGYSTYTTTYNNDGSPVAHDVTITMGKDPQGNQLILEMAHVGTANGLTPGQQVKKGDLIATMGNGDCDTGPCPHTHVEAWGYSPELGAYRLIDPNLLMNGYYDAHSVDDTSTTPAPTTPADSSTTAAPAPQLRAPTESGSEVQYQIDAAAPVAPPPQSLLGRVGQAAQGAADYLGQAQSYTTKDGTTYDLVGPNGTPTTPNYGYTDGTAYPDNPDGTRALDPKYVVYHYTATDDMDGFIRDFMGETDKATSSNYVLDKDGRLYTIVPPDYTAWANGRIDMPPADMTPGANLNQESISIEIVNNGSEPYTPEQIATLQSWTQAMSSQYGIAPDHLIGHSDVTSDKSDPGDLFPWDLVRASAR